MPTLILFVAQKNHSKDEWYKNRTALIFLLSPELNCFISIILDILYYYSRLVAGDIQESGCF